MTWMDLHFFKAGLRRLHLEFLVDGAFWRSRTGLSLILCVTVLVGSTAGAVIYFYTSFSSLIRERLAGNVYQSTSQVYSIPRRISVGELLDSKELINYLRAAGYTESGNRDAAGSYKTSGASLEIHPSRKSYFSFHNALRVGFAGRRIARIRALDAGTRVATAEIEPELITNLFAVEREKRRPVGFSDIPKHLVQAVLSAEDKRFFDHPGFDPIRILGAAWADLRRGEKAQGASTISMQVARTFFFTTERLWSRKIRETFMALMLEHRFTKEQIFELYANQVYLGNRGSFAIRGFGEAAEAYFGKDVRELTLAEAAFIAGIIRAPNRYTAAERKPERAAEARDRVLAQMLDNGFISAAEAQSAKKPPLRLISAGFGSSLAAYYIDMLKEDLSDRFAESDLTARSFHIYTELDLALQSCAAQAVEWGMKNVDTQLARRYALWRRRGEVVPLPQVALVALDPRTGGIRALIGGRDYGASQLNHALASRQPGSAFKPFVYAAAFDNALEGIDPALTPATTVVDEPTTFQFDGKGYTPNNYGENFYGTVSLRDALTHSLNVATVKVAEQIGYVRVVEFAKNLGLTADLQPTPAIALGAYEMTPLEICAGYTPFDNAGIRSEPRLLHSVVGPDGEPAARPAEKHRPVLDPRIAYMVANILEDVMNRGTAAGVRSRGFRAPAAGKTGTSRDGWFVGFTSNLLCVVWVGFDDNRELGLSGAASAAPIWAEFMRRAVALPRYRDTQEFERPEGVVFVTIDPESGQVATPACPVTRDEVFLAGTEPTESCATHPANPLPAPLSWIRRLLRRRG
jgi:penicillin-binding protein 1B